MSSRTVQADGGVNFGRLRCPDVVLLAGQVGI
jgi:hypothetical protein